MNYRNVLLAVALAASLPVAHAAANLAMCGELNNTFGPFDFRDPVNVTNLSLVETAHFTSNVEQGQHGNSGTLGQELFYTLRAFPNHPRALATLSRIALRDNLVQIPDMRYPVECFFDRALRFQPEDAQVRALFGQYLYARGQTDRALGFLEQAAKLEPTSGPIQYNLGIAYFKLKRYPEANLAAQRAYSRSFPLPGLRRMLTDAGAWKPEVDLGPMTPPGAEPDAAPEAKAAKDAATASANDGNTQ